jgi:hypothetical protein
LQASREEEFVDKIKGLSYADIAAKRRWYFKLSQEIKCDE